MTDYQFKTTPFAHQYKAFEISKDATAFGLFLEQRTGKTKVVLDTAAYNHQQGRIRTLLVIAFPNGVHRNWIDDEAPVHMGIPYNAILWRASASSGKRWMADALQKLADPKFLIVSVNVESVDTERCKAFLKMVIKRGPFMCCIDESTSISTPGAGRTKVCLKLGQYAAMRRLATGTPADQGPLKLWSQFMFLDPTILGHKSFFTFKHHYAEWKKEYNGQTGTEYDALVGYKNLPELLSRIKPFIFRVTKEECFDLPPKIYQKHRFTLTKEQRQLYTKLQEEYRAELAQGQITVPHVLTRMMRLQQIAAGYVPLDAGSSICEACGGDGCSVCNDLGIVGTERVVYKTIKNPRLEACMEEVLRAKGQIIIWARFNYDMELLQEALVKADISFVRYDGSVNEKQRAENKLAYQQGRARVFLGKSRAAGRGLELAADTTTMIYYTNEFSLELRRQSEDRAHGPKQKHSLDVIDIIGEDTVDEDVVQILRDRRNLADLIHGDPTRQWI